MKYQALYNDIEDHCAKVLGLRVDEGWLPAGRITQADIRRLCRINSSKYNQVHLFAGIGGFPLACRMSGLPDDFRILTGGFPCQPFSNAGKQDGADDNRYLWPETLAAFEKHRPDVAIFENVAGLASMVFPSEGVKVEGQANLEVEDGYTVQMVGQGILDRVCEDIEQAGYTVQPIIVPACGVAAPHQRNRIWIVAYRNGLRKQSGSESWNKTRHWSCDSGQASDRCTERSAQTSKFKGAGRSSNNGSMANSERKQNNQKRRPDQFRRDAVGRDQQTSQRENGKTSSNGSGGRSGYQAASPAKPSIPDTESGRVRERRNSDSEKGSRKSRNAQSFGKCADVSNPSSKRQPRQGEHVQRGGNSSGRKREADIFVPECQPFEWPVEPAVRRVDHGVPIRVERLTSLGNAIVPQVAAEIIRFIMLSLGVEPEYHPAFDKAA